MRRPAEPVARRAATWLLGLALFAALPAAALAQRATAVAAPASFGALIERLSEPGGYFDTDNLISNESSYLHALGGLRRLGVRGGAYVGVGPDQNFSYMAVVRPEVAYLVDIRRDNLLLHLLFKAAFVEAPTRVEYLGLLFGRAPPADAARWDRRPIEDLVAWLDAAPPADRRRASTRVLQRVARFGLALGPADYQTIERFHRAFMAAGLDLRFTSQGRGPRPGYPTYRELMLARDLEGRPGHYLVREDDYRFLRDLQAADRVVPVVGDLSGPHALAAIGDDARARGLVISVLYASNVEFYLFGTGRFERYAGTVERLPRYARSVIIRSWFERGRTHPFARPGHNSTQVVQTMDAFVAGLADGYRSYWDVVTRDPIPPA